MALSLKPGAFVSCRKVIVMHLLFLAAAHHASATVAQASPTWTPKSGAEITADVITGFTVFFCALFLYLLPSVIATMKRHPYGVGVMLLNLFLGWTIIGWVGALVWSVCPPQRPTYVVPDRRRRQV
jgi:Superinfection immunity protein